MQPLHSRILERIYADFSGADVDTVIQKLVTTRALPMIAKDWPHLQMAILEIARGDTARLDDALQLAEIDWRDLLLEAGMAETAEW
ncbi:MAG: hypothetical protein O7B23_14940 [Deltaproteobacteria bacterium]|nr:hypothetical protein [Deltaproteobacteria bacterium]